ncbi:MAG: extracellular solute-binding protein [Anaerolineae bacterium]|nr:extracellular solute-binding protein [Anaerolineae bacterium]
MYRAFRPMLASLLLIAALSIGLVGAPAVAQDTPMADSIRVSVVAGAMQNTMTGLVATYQEANPGVEITLELEPEGGAFQALVAAGNQPDLIITSLGPQLGTLAAQDAALPLEDLEGAAELFDRLEPRSLQRLYGHNYYVPIGADVTLMIYNKALFEEAGLDPENPPKTFDEFLAAAEAIDNLPDRANGDEVYGTLFWNEALQWGGWYWNMLQPIYLNANQNACQLMNSLGTDIAFDDEECKLREFFEVTSAAQKFAPPTMEKNFFTRTMGMWLQYGYSWEPNLNEAAEQPMVIGEDVGVAPVPVPNEGDTSYTTFGGRALMILKTTPEREARAWDFLKFLMEDENNLTFIKELGYLPVIKALQSDPYFQEPARAPFVALLQNGILPEQFANAEKAASALQGVYQAVVVEGTTSIEDAVSAAAEAARTAIQAQ